MTRNLLVVFAAGFCLLLTASPLLAHHSSWAQFDPNDPVEMEGVVVKVEWRNPHIWYYIDVTDESGKVTTWGFSGGAPGMLVRRGVPRDSLKIGAAVKVTGFRAHDGSNNASGNGVTFADGRRVFTGALDQARP